jgi:hypothetical protein
MDATTSSKLPWAMGFFAALLLWPSVNFAQVATSFSGDATAAKGKIGTTPFEVDHLSLPSTGGTLELTDLEVKAIPGGCVGNCGDGGQTQLSTNGSGLSSLSTAEVGDFKVVIGGHSIIVNFSSSSASASCPASMGDASQTSSFGYVASVLIDESYSSTTDFPGGITDHQTFPVGVDGTVSVNQVASNTTTAASGDITLNAIQIDMANGDQIVVGSSHAGVTCSKAPTGGGGGNGGCPGKVTGGGVFMLNNQRQSFGFVAGTKKDGTSFGNFNYVNHGNGDHLQGSVASVMIDNTVSPPMATVTGTLKTGGAYTLVVVDAGEPGRADTFNLTSGPVNTGGPIALDPRGGNIQIHKGCGKK